MKILQKILLVAVLGLANAASADPIIADESYTLGNHPNGAAASPFYGLRLDGLLSGNSSHIYTFDFEAPGALMQMLWDSADDSIRIWGTAFGGRDIGSSYLVGTTASWMIDFLYTGVSPCGSSGAVCSNSGQGTIRSDAFGSFDLTPVGAATHGYTFQVADGHRGVPDLSGWGWVNHCPSSGNSHAGGSCSKHLYSSDWLFTAHPVPEPGTLTLFGLGLVALGLARRRRSTAL